MPITIKNKLEGSGGLERCTEIISYILLIITFPFSLIICFTIVPDYYRLVVFRNGRLRVKNPLGPGLVFTLPCIDSYFEIDLRCLVIDILPQDILTKDSVSIYVNGLVYFHVHDPIKCVTQVEHYIKSTELLAQTSLRNAVGELDLQSLITQKENISTNLTNIIDKSADKWGISIERVELLDVRLPMSLQRSMAAEAEAQREAKAKIIMADGEYRASEALKKASDILTKNKSTIQLRYLQALNALASDRKTTIYFPIPVELGGYT